VRPYNLVKLAHAGITIPGQVETIAGQGMPVHNSHKTFGNLIVTYQVNFPKVLNDAKKKQVKELFQGMF